MNSRRQVGFTLIELLTVIAIIGILAAIIIPTVGRVRESAATASDTSNLRQIGQGIQLHIADNKGAFPNQYTAPIPGIPVDPSTGRSRWTFPEAVDRYFGKGPTFDPRRDLNFLRRGNMWFSKFAEPYPGFTPIDANQTRPVAYGYNPYVEHARWRTISNVPSPSKIVIVSEANDAGGYKMFRAMEGQSGHTFEMTTAADVRSTYRVNRSGRALYLFADGSIKSLSGDQSELALRTAGLPNIWRWW